MSVSREELRLRILRLLEQNPEMSQRGIAGELGVSLGGVNYALKALIERGFVKAGNFGRSENKTAFLYLLTPAGLAQKSALATSFLRRKLVEYEALKQEIESLKREVSAGQEVKS
jgi:EPS-associated MarR family transcriptional regulator